MTWRWLRWVVGRPNGYRRWVLAWARRRWNAERPVSPSGEPAETAESPAAASEPGVSWRYVDVLAADEVGEGEVVEVFVNGAPLAVCRVQGVLFAVDGTCPHAGGPLSDGDVDGHGLLCPMHGWEFDVRDGSCEVDPDSSVRTHEVRTRQGRIEIGVHPDVA